MHAPRFIGKRAERFMSESFEAGPRNIIYLEMKNVVCYQSKHDAIAIYGVAAKHAPHSDFTQRPHPLRNKAQIFGFVWHPRSPPKIDVTALRIRGQQGDSNLIANVRLMFSTH